LLEKTGEHGFLDLKPDVQRDYNEVLHKDFQKTIWASGCNSWYVNAEGRNTVLYPRLTMNFRRETKDINRQEYELVTQ